MGQVIPKTYVVVGGVSNPDNNQFNDIQKAIDSVEYGSTLVLCSDNYSSSTAIKLKSGIKFIGLNKCKISCLFTGEASDIIFENITFENVNNSSIQFLDIKGLLFINCEFVINIKGTFRGRGKEKIKGSKDKFSKKESSTIVSGFLLSDSSALFRNPIFYVDVENVEIFATIAVDKGSSYITLQSPIIRVKYKNVHRLETYLYKGCKDLNTGYFKAFSSCIHYRPISSSKESSNKSHYIDDGDFERPINIRLFRGANLFNTTIIGTSILFIDGLGTFDISSSNCLVYINGLTASSSNPIKWKIGEFNNLLLTAFMSNLKYSSEIKECPYLNQIKDEHELNDNRVPPPYLPDNYLSEEYTFVNKEENRKYKPINLKPEEETEITQRRDNPCKQSLPKLTEDISANDSC